jgi:DNA-binding NarL/FixJ family response regulator
MTQQRPDDASADESPASPCRLRQPRVIAQGELVEEARRSTVLLGRFSPLLGCGLAQILSEDGSIRLIDGDPDGLGCAITRLRPNVVVLDAVDSSLVRQLRALHPTVGIIVLAHDPGRLYAAELIAAGASCLAIEASALDILAAIHRAAVGEHTLVLRGDPRGKDVAGSGKAALTQREGEVFDGMRLGQSYSEIAAGLGVGIETVRTHAARVRRKLGVSRKAELIGLQEPIPRRQ